LCLMLLVPPKPSTDNMIGGLFVGACGLFGLVLGLIGGATRATHVVRGKYGPRWRERIRNPNQEWVVSPETNPPSAPGGSVGRSRFRFRISNLLMSMLWWSLFGGFISALRRINPNAQDWPYLTKAIAVYTSFVLFYTLPCVAIAAVLGETRRGLYIGFAFGVFFVVVDALSGMSEVR
jgi:hypothetical protein